MHSIYKVPLIPQNLRQDETIIQIADALKYLSDVSNDIFEHVNKRIESNSKQLENLTNRINGARNKVVKLTGAKKATQVYSSSKYPAADVHRQYKTVFDETQVKFVRTPYKFESLKMNDEPLDTLQFYHVKVDETKRSEKIDGLGSIPSDLTSVNDLFLYNTGKNPYKSYIVSDPLHVAFRTKKEEVRDTSDIGAAPHSISERATLTRSATEAYFYSPGLGEVPSIDVPLDLPDLPGIADDLRYVDVQEPGIAPSVLTSPNIPDLPQLEKVEALLSPILPPPPPAQLIQIAPVQPKIEEPTQPKPEEPRAQPILEEAPKLMEPARVTEPVSALPVERKTEVKKLPVVEDNAHASLMAAIRKAGGSKNAKLKTAEPTKVAPSGDLMADLHSKLSLRRKGISGSKNQETSNELQGHSTMQKISAMIPPPPTVESESTNTEDEDWD